ncbi:MAG TPA: AI-2E family transporter [Acidobacteriota bacterium]|nr:AI-2E family transporter [Acidobacteriota bacterium]
MPIRQWLKRNFEDPQVVFFLIILVGTVAVFYLLGNVLAPVVAAIIVAYLLEGLVCQLDDRGIPRLLAVIIVFLLFLVALGGLYFAVIPVLLDQMAEFTQQLPSLVSRLQDALQELSRNYPALVSQEDLANILDSIRSEIVSALQQVIRLSFDSVIPLVVNLFLIPFMVFFFLKDKTLILQEVGRFLPRHRELSTRVWNDVDQQIGNYLRGKVWEILIIWGVSAAVFAILGLEVPVLIGFLVGLSVLVPYVGVAAMTVPVALVAFLQWGASSDFLAVLIAYVVIQLIDGNVLAPLLLSEVVQLHPVAIIISILVFGGIWGFWGVFFAVPLATLVRAVYRAWPRNQETEQATAA